MDRSVATFRGISTGEDAIARLEGRCRFAAALGASYMITNAAKRDRSDAFFRQADTLAAMRNNMVFAFC
jgi:hypothetical protein